MTGTFTGSVSPPAPAVWLRAALASASLTWAGDRERIGRDYRSQQHVGKDASWRESWQQAPQQGGNKFSSVSIYACVRAGEGAHRDRDYYSPAELLLPAQVQEPLTENSR